MSRQDRLDAARSALAGGMYDDAAAAAEAGLRIAEAGSIDEREDATSWGLELARLEALARAGRGAEAKAQLERIADRYPSRIVASEFYATAQQLKGAGEGIAAIEVLDMGAILFPYEPIIDRMIEESSESGDPAELELLKSLGYVDS